jgi:hypothetical protein
MSQDDFERMEFLQQDRANGMLDSEDENELDYLEGLFEKEGRRS